MKENTRAGIKVAKTGGAIAGGTGDGREEEIRISLRNYHNHYGQSRKKLQIGTLLLALQSPLSCEQQKICWTLFESMLRQYVDLKLCKVQ